MKKATRDAVLQRDGFRCQLEGPRCLNRQAPAGVPLLERYRSKIL